MNSPTEPDGGAVAPYRALSHAEACDLDLLLAGVVPTGWLLGGPANPPAVPPGTPGTSSDGTAAPRAAVCVTPDLAGAAAAAGALILLDEEQTPLASLAELVHEDREGRPVLLGRVHPLRRRESGPLPELRVDLTDPGHAGRAVLVLGRAPVVQDEAPLAAWAEAAGPAPLLLVPEGGDGVGHLPAVTAWNLARDLAARYDLPKANVLVVPVFMRGGEVDERLARLVASRVGSGRVLTLTVSCGSDAARTWLHAAGELQAGTAPGPLPGVDPDVEGRLRHWRPRRAERGLVVLMSGLSGSGKSTVARDLQTHLLTRSERSVTLLDGDVVRRLLSSGLGFDRASRELNVRRIGWVAARLAEHGGTAICSPIAPFAQTRQEVRHMVEQVADLVLVHVSTPLQECERRDLKGLYARARAGEIPDFTGISSPYEVPVDADVRVDTTHLTRPQAVQVVVDHLVDGGWLPEASR